MGLNDIELAISSELSQKAELTAGENALIGSRLSMSALPNGLSRIF